MNDRIAVLFAVVLLCFAMSGCGGAGGEDAPESESPDDRAAALAQKLVILDTHIDVPYRLREKLEDISGPTERGDFDYPRARAGGLDVAFMSIYVPASYQDKGGARGVADELIDMVEGFSRDHPEKFMPVASPDDARASHASGKIGLALGIENGAAIEDDLANLEHFFDRGVRYITLTHSANNRICDSSYADEREWNGLSPFGREVVSEMNRLGIMIDISHVSDDTAHQVLDLSRAPVIASHSSCRHFTPGWERNIDDDLIRRVAEGGGVVHVNFGSAFLLDDARKQSEAFWSELRGFMDEHGIDDFNDPGLEAYREGFWRDTERIYADVSDVVAHIDHVVRLVGVDHVGLGSDFDGVGDSLPTGLKDVSYYPNLIRKLLEHGYTEADVRKICADNLLRAWSEVERVAREIGRSD